MHIKYTRFHTVLDMRLKCACCTYKERVWLGYLLFDHKVPVRKAGSEI